MQSSEHFSLSTALVVARQLPTIHFAYWRKIPSKYAVDGELLQNMQYNVAFMFIEYE